MSAIYPATEENIRGFTPDGKAVVERKSHEMPVRFTGLVETAGKKVSKEIQWEKAKVEGYRADMIETTEGMIGASPADDLSSSISYENPRSKWTPREKKQYADFIRLWRKYRAEVIPVEREGLKQMLLDRFGTIHPDMMVQNLNVQMIKDPRLMIRVRRGIVKTSVKAQHERVSRSLEGGKS